MSAIILLATLTQITNPPSLATKPVAEVTPLAIVRLDNLSNKSSNKATSGKEQLERGIILYQVHRFSESIQFFQQASESFKTNDDGLNQALALNYLSLAYQQLGKFNDAETAITTSLTFLQKKDGSKDYLSVRAQALNIQGKLQLLQGKAELALKTWEKATKVYTQIGDEAGVIGSQINQAQALQTLGFYRRAQNTLENLKQNLDKQPNSTLKVKGLLNLGNTQRAVGNLEKSEKVLEEAKQLAEKLRSKQIVAEINLSLGNTYQALAKIETGEGNKLGKFTQKALDSYSEVAKISASPSLQVQAQLNKFRLLVEKDKDAQQNLSKAPELSTILSELDKLPLSRQKVYARINLSQSLIKLKQKLPANLSWEYIAEIAKAGVDEAKTLEDARAQAYALGTLGSIEEKNKQWKEAQKLSEEAVKLAEGIYASDIAYRWRWQLGRIYKANGNFEQAKGAYKQALNHLKSLRNDLASISRDVQFSFQEEVEPVYREYVSLLLPETESAQVSQENLKEARDVIESLKIAELDNFFRRACLDVDDKPVSLNDIDPKAAVIYPIILPDRLAVIVSLSDREPQNQESQLKQGQKEERERKGEETLKLKQHFFSKEFPSEQEFKKIITTLRSEQLVDEQNKGSYLKPLQDVYNWLIEPFEGEFKNNQVDNLVFVLDGSLRNIPMAALHNGKQFLVQTKYNIAISPGLKLLPPKRSGRLKLKLFASGLSELDSKNPIHENFQKLDNVEEEINTITKKIIPNSEKLKNEEFTNNALAKKIQSFPASIVLFATHGTFNTSAENTFILSWDKKINADELGTLLKSQENQQNTIDLLVLSACQTASGNEQAAIGLAGVAVQSGARSTVATLWNVDDKATSKLMIEFFKQLSENPNITKAQALKRAQLHLLKENYTLHPYYWAPYVLVGNWL